MPNICKSCAGTGLYSGVSERHGYAVPCTRCKGRGGEPGFRRIHPRDVTEILNGGWGVERINAIHTVELTVSEFHQLFK